MTDVKPGLTPRGKKMPQTPEEWDQLAKVYEHKMIKDQVANSALRVQVAKLTAKNDKLRRIVKRLRETGGQW